jgi:hypothetical protein
MFPRKILSIPILAASATLAFGQFAGFVNKGLVGVGRVPAATFDKAGDGRQERDGEQARGGCPGGEVERGGEHRRDGVERHVGQRRPRVVALDVALSARRRRERKEDGDRTAAAGQANIPTPAAALARANSSIPAPHPIHPARAGVAASATGVMSAERVTLIGLFFSEAAASASSRV